MTMSLDSLTRKCLKIILTQYAWAWAQFFGESRLKSTKIGDKGFEPLFQENLSATITPIPFLELIAKFAY